MFDSDSPLRSSIGVSVMSRPPALTDWSVQPRALPAGRIKCDPAGTPSRTNFPSLSSRAFGCGPTNPGSLDGAVIRNCVTSGGDVAADGKLATPEIVAP